MVFLRVLGILFLTGVFFLSVFVFVLNVYVKPYALKELSKYLTIEVKCGAVYINPFKKGEVICKNPYAVNEYGRILEAEAAVIKISFDEFRLKKIKIKEIYFEKPHILIVKKGNIFNISKLIERVSKSSGKIPAIEFLMKDIVFLESDLTFCDMENFHVIRFPSSDITIGLRQPGTRISLVTRFKKNPFVVIAKRTQNWYIYAANRDVSLSDLLPSVGVKQKVKGRFDTRILYKGDFKTPGLIEGFVRLKNVSYNGLHADGIVEFNKKDFNARISINKNSLELKGKFSLKKLEITSLRVEGSTFTSIGTGELNIKKFKLYSEFKDMPVKTSFFNGRITGRGSVNGIFSRIKLSNAEVDIVQGEGKLPKLSFVYNILQVTEIFNFLVGKFPQFKDFFPVDKIHGRILKENEKIKIKEIFLENDVSRILITGVVDIENETLDLVIAFQTQKFINELLSKIPLVGFVLVGEKKMLLPVLIEVKGSFKKPEIKTKALKTLTGPVFGIIKRTFKLPVKILERITE